METIKPNIVIIGASGHAKVVIDIIEKENKYNIIGLLDSFKSMGKKIFKYEIIGTEQDISVLKNKFNFNSGIIAIGDNCTRRKMKNKIEKLVPDFKFISAVHPDSVIGKNVFIGVGSVIMPGVIINSDSKIGEFCIINTKASLGHDSILEKYASLAPNVTTGGNVTIGTCSAVSMGSNILQGIKIGKHTIIGAGTLVNRDIIDYKMAYGIPARIIKPIETGEKYLYHDDNLIKDKSDKNKSCLNVITDKTEWDLLLKEIRFYDFYHTYGYHELAKKENETPILLKYVEKQIMIGIPLLIRNIPNSQYKDATSVYGYAGPISKNIPVGFNNNQFKTELFKYFNKNNIVSVFSRLNPYIKNQCNVLSNIGLITNQGQVVNINVQLDLEKQKASLQNRLKTYINKTRRICSIKLATTQEDLQEFIKIYYENMDRVVANNYYYFSESYFHSLFNSTSINCEILLAVDNETESVIAGCQFITTNGIVQYHLSGTKNDYLHLNATKLLIDEMRIIATQRGNKFYNLGGGLGGRSDDSLFHFKSSFSKDFKDFNLWKLIVNQKVYDELVVKKGIIEKSDYFPVYRSIDDFIINI